MTNKEKQKVINDVCADIKSRITVEDIPDSYEGDQIIEVIANFILSHFNLEVKNKKII